MMRDRLIVVERFYFKIMMARSFIQIDAFDPTA